MVSTVVQEFRVVQTFRWLGLRLLVRLYIRCCRRAVLQSETQDRDNDDADQRKVDFFRPLFCHLVLGIA
jgi:hypothetical protein